ncbi:MAG TPA: Rieske 2Fe-2S domain-containing protein [Chloroflexota bacterium]|nr:Rieske 2Fe-2S domain-containing protein [Chloroflexota bacterium]
MFLSAEENRKLTQVGPGTPGGELLRRYWHPVAGLHQLTAEQPTAFVRLLGEDLVLFRDRSGRTGLIADHCAHRGASLLYGRVEERGIACAYHGWLYDTAGSCLECPAEPAGSMFHLTVKQRAYPVRTYLGLYWAYLGPTPPPPIRKLDIGAYPVEHIMEMPLDANWVQVVENNMDGAHIGILHQDTTGRTGTVRSTTRGITDELVSLEYREVPCGIQRTMVTKDGFVEDDPLVFPNMLRRITELSIKVPVDDEHTRKFVVFVSAERGGERNGDDLEPADYYVMPPDDGKSAAGHYPHVDYRMNRLRYQDLMAIETQGTVSDRTEWHLATSDRGVALFERMLLREMDRVRDGHDPVGVTRDPDEVIDTNFEFYRHAGGLLPVPQGVRVYTRSRPALSS